MPDPPPRLFALLAIAIWLAACSCTRSSGAESTGAETSGTETSGASAASTPRTASAGRSFEGNGVSFTYPTHWRAFREMQASAVAGDQVWSRSVGIDGRNLVIVAEYAQSIAITPDNVAERATDVRAELESIFAQAGGSLTSGPRAREMGGLPALAFTGTVPTVRGEAVEDRVVLAFDGTTEYFMNCQYDERTRAELLDGCRQIASTFEVTG